MSETRMTEVTIYAQGFQAGVRFVNQALADRATEDDAPLLAYLREVEELSKVFPDTVYDDPAAELENRLG